MTKNLYIVSIALMSLIGLFLVGILVTGIIHGNSFIGSFNVDKTEANIRKQEEYNLTDITELKLEFVPSDLNIILTDDTTLKVIQYSNVDLEIDKLFRSDDNDGVLRINEDYFKNYLFLWGFSNYTSAYDIYLPKTYNKDLTIKTVSGEITINGDLILENMRVNSTSGNINLNSVKATNDFIAKTISGEVTIDKIEATNTNIETTSGNMQVGSIKADNTMHSISGKIKIEQMSGHIDIGTTSGDIEINNYDIKEDSNIKSISGEVYISFVPDTNCELDINTVSGNVNLPNRSYRIGKEPYRNLMIRTTSGNIKATVNEDL